jgi:hypothetical protein
VTHSALIHRQLANAKRLVEKLPGVKVMPTAARMTRKVCKRAFLGNELLQSGDAPIKGCFSWACITGELDRNKGHWFGPIKTMTFWATDSMNRIASHRPGRPSSQRAREPAGTRQCQFCWRPCQPFFSRAAIVPTQKKLCVSSDG